MHWKTYKLSRRVVYHRMYQDIIASQKEMQQQQNTDQNQTSMPSVSF